MKRDHSYAISIRVSEKSRYRVARVACLDYVSNPSGMMDRQRAFETCKNLWLAMGGIMQRNIGARSKIVIALKTRSDEFLNVDLVTILS